MQCLVSSLSVFIVFLSLVNTFFSCFTNQKKEHSFQYIKFFSSSFFFFTKFIFIKGRKHIVGIVLSSSPIKQIRHGLGSDTPLNFACSIISFQLASDILAICHKITCRIDYCVRFFPSPPFPSLSLSLSLSVSLFLTCPFYLPRSSCR